ncbi:MAG: dihydroorotate dehydrogenase [Desulfobacterales bacterium]|nr:dihydroorotate dehydrogenase [Desulfobacterales bacterium]MBF0396803.1 dihydroorotate dehydrogenase [Desulfobacterales bacterium]
MSPDLKVSLGKITLKNPVMTASGTFGYGIEFEDLVDLEKLGAIIVKGLSLKPNKGNPPPRIVETQCGMLNSIGLENIGIESFINDKLPLLKKYNTPIFVNIYGKTIEEYIEISDIIDKISDISGIEVNISCPNVKAGGIAFGVDPNAAFQVISKIREKTTKFLMVKLSPNVSDIKAIAKSVENAGADAISLINTLTGMAIDIDKRTPKLANIIGGLSGPAIKPIALRMVWETVQAVKIPVVGIGGIITSNDALEFLIAGAKSIQIGTANFINPKATIDIIDGIEKFLIEKNINSITNIIGSIKI